MDLFVISYSATRIGASPSSLNTAISMLRRRSQGHDALELLAVVAGTRIGAMASSLNAAISAC